MKTRLIWIFILGYLSGIIALAVCEPARNERYRIEMLQQENIELREALDAYHHTMTAMEEDIECLGGGTLGYQDQD